MVAQQPKLFNHKPKKVKSLAGKVDGASPAHDMATTNSTGVPPLPPKPPLLYRMRGLFGVLLTINLFVGGYMLFRGKDLIRSSHHMDEEEEEKTEEQERKKKQKAGQQSNSAAHEAKPTTVLLATPSSAGHVPSNGKSGDREGKQREGGKEREEERGGEGHVPEWVIDGLMYPKPTSPPLSRDEQVKILNWILEEKRKVRATSREEKARIDDEKKLLKSLIKSKGRLPLRDA